MITCSDQVNDANTNEMIIDKDPDILSNIQYNFSPNLSLFNEDFDVLMNFDSSEEFTLTISVNVIYSVI